MGVTASKKNRKRRKRGSPSLGITGEGLKRRKRSGNPGSAGGKAKEEQSFCRKDATLQALSSEVTGKGEEKDLARI